MGNLDFHFHMAYVPLSLLECYQKNLVTKMTLTFSQLDKICDRFLSASRSLTSLS